MFGQCAGRGFSVVIPVYNGERFLGEAIRSALGQSLPPLEVLVVDDGSTDASRSVAARFGGLVRLVSQENAGPSAARNRGVREARGPWIAFLDSDDRWEKEYLRIADAHLAAHPGVGVLCFGVRALSEGGRPTRHVIHKKTPGPAYTTAGMLEGDVGTICTPLVSREIFLRSGGFDESLRGNEDCHLWLRLSLVTAVHQSPEPLLLCRRHPGNASGDVLANARESVRSLERLETSHPEFREAYARSLRRIRGKEYLRLGRELLAAGRGPADLAAARFALARAVGDRPGRLRGWVYLAVAWAPGGRKLFAGWRRAELAVRQRLRESQAAAAFRAFRRQVRAAVP